MPTRLVLVRHGQSIWNATRLWQGHADVPLSEIGRGQALEADAVPRLRLGQHPEQEAAS